MLARKVPELLATPEYRSGTTAIFITWDESFAVTQHIATYVIAPSVPVGARSATLYTHYSLCRTVEELLGLKPLLGMAASATSMRAGFRI